MTGVVLSSPAPPAARHRRRAAITTTHGGTAGVTGANVRRHRSFLPFGSARRHPCCIAVSPIMDSPHVGLMITRVVQGRAGSAGARTTECDTISVQDLEAIPVSLERNIRAQGGRRANLVSRASHIKTPETVAFPARAGPRGLRRRKHASALPTVLKKARRIASKFNAETSPSPITDLPCRLRLLSSPSDLRSGARATLEFSNSRSPSPA